MINDKFHPRQSLIKDLVEFSKNRLFILRNVQSLGWLLRHIKIGMKLVLAYLDQIIHKLIVRPLFQVRERLYGLVSPDTDGLVTADQVVERVANTKAVGYVATFYNTSNYGRSRTNVFANGYWSEQSDVLLSCYLLPKLLLSLLGRQFCLGHLNVRHCLPMSDKTGPSIIAFKTNNSYFRERNELAGENLRWLEKVFKGTVGDHGEITLNDFKTIVQSKNVSHKPQSQMIDQNFNILKYGSDRAL